MKIYISYVFSKTEFDNIQILHAQIDIPNRLVD
ncbi:MAG: hypothetical protein RLY89_41 [Bacteroidota bacterium]|jgi:hypothetical protein